MNTTIAKHLNVKEFPFIIRDSRYNEIYFETSDGTWERREHDSSGNQIYYENSDRLWAKEEYNSEGKRIYYCDSNGFWSKTEYDSEGNRIYYENSDGLIKDNRKIPEFTMEDLVEKLGNFKLIK